MRNGIRVIALDLDGTLLNSKKELSPKNLAALERAAAAGIEIVPTTGRFYDGMPDEIKRLPFLRYAILMNGAKAADLKTGEVIYAAEIPRARAVEIMRLLDPLPVIYDCFLGDAGWMSEAHKELIDDFIDSPHYRKMFRELRRGVPELKDFVAASGRDVQKIQFFTHDEPLRRDFLKNLAKRFDGVCVSSSVPQNVEINALNANKGEALLALAARLGLGREETLAFGDGLNDLSMLRAAGTGVAMENACAEAKQAADFVTASCDEDGVARGILRFCFGEE